MYLLLIEILVQSHKNIHCKELYHNSIWARIISFIKAKAIRYTVFIKKYICTLFFLVSSLFLTVSSFINLSILFLSSGFLSKRDGFELLLVFFQSKYLLLTPSNFLFFFGLLKSWVCNFSIFLFSRLLSYFKARAWFGSGFCLLIFEFVLSSQIGRLLRGLTIFLLLFWIAKISNSFGEKSNLKLLKFKIDWAYTCALNRQIC